MDAYRLGWALGISEMTRKRLICAICKKKQWGLIMMLGKDKTKDFGLCNECYEIWDGVNSKLDITIGVLI